MPFISETLEAVSPDSEFSSEFEDLVLIHESPSGKLYMATRYGRRFVLKTKASDRGKDIVMLKREYELTRMLSHPQIVYVNSYEPDSAVGPCIVMEYIEGVTLREFLETKPPFRLRLRIFG